MEDHTILTLSKCHFDVFVVIFNFQIDFQFEMMTYRSETTNAVVFMDLRQKIKQVHIYRSNINRK